MQVTILYSTNHYQNQVHFFYCNCVGFLSPDEYAWDFPINYTESLFNSFSCSSYATESSLSQCTQPSSISYSECGVACQYPKAIKCHSMFFDTVMLMLNLDKCTKC